MKYLVVSDSHGDRNILVSIFNRFQEKVDAVFHAGDSELAPTDAVFDGVTVVGGNMDFDAGFQMEAVVKNSLDTILLAHGHLLGIKSDLTKIGLAAQAVQANLIFFGHSHELGCELTDGMLFVNPGSISQPRGEYARLGGTFAMVESTVDHYQVTYYNRQLIAVPEMSFSFSRQ